MPLCVEHIFKSFPGTKALDDVSLCVEPGLVHALLGANGSGKSTLVKILTGVYQPDSGAIQIGNRQMPAISSPGEAERLGIRVVHQEAPLIDTLTVAECVALFRGYPTRGAGRIRWAALVTSVTELFDRLGIPVNPRERAGQLGPAQRAMVSLAIALAGIDQGVNLLILDEATASLPETDAEVFLERVKHIAQSGVAVLMVTHRLKEALAIAEEVTVLANGRIVHRGSMDDATEDLLIAKMIGQPVQHLTAAEVVSEGGYAQTLWEAANRSEPRRSTNAPALKVEHLAGQFLHDVSFMLDHGSIVGVTGLPESGVGELPLMLAGALPHLSGTIRVDGNELPPTLSPRESIRAGIALVPADRLRQGGISSLPVRENLVLPDAPRYWHRDQYEDRVVRSAIDVLDVRPPKDEVLFGGLSGGNQQKVILAKWLLLHPSVLILDDPTSGVDPGARLKIFDVLRDAAHHGVGILFFSTEPEQLVLMCNSVLVLGKGVVVKELQADDLTVDAIVQWSYS
jgi:ABC-type sugar transport system ATPase subunit